MSTPDEVQQRIRTNAVSIATGATVHQLANALEVSHDAARRLVIAELLRQMRPPGCPQCGARMPE